MESRLRSLFMMVLTVLGLGVSGLALADDVPDPMMSEIVVNINEADAATLAEFLDGVGLSRAEAIVRYREEHGKFYSAEELTAVRGIGESTVAKNEARITVE